jgi:hypothetical protein
MYFQEKKKAREFIEFYHDYVTRHPQKVKRSTPTNGTNNRTEDEQ